LINKILVYKSIQHFQLAKDIWIKLQNLIEKKRHENGQIALPKKCENLLDKLRLSLRQASKKYQLEDLTLLS